LVEISTSCRDFREHEFRCLSNCQAHIRIRKKYQGRPRVVCHNRQRYLKAMFNPIRCAFDQTQILTTMTVIAIPTWGKNKEGEGEKKGEKKKKRGEPKQG